MKKFIQQMYKKSIYLLVLIFPLSVYFPLAGAPSTEVLEIYSSPVVYWTDFVIFAAIILGVLQKGFIQKALLVITNLRIQVIFFAGIIFLNILSIPRAISPTLAFYYSCRWLFLFVLYLVIVSSEINFKQLTKLFVIGAAFQSLIGLLQFVNRNPIGIPGEMALSVDQFRSAKISVGGVRWLRAYGLTFHPNVLGGILFCGLTLGLPLLKQKRFQILWGLMGLGLAVSFSRSAWLATFISLSIVFIWVLWKFKNYRRSLWIALICIMLLGMISSFFLFDQIKMRLQPFGSISEISSLYERGQLIEIGYFCISPQKGIF